MSLMLPNIRTAFGEEFDGNGTIYVGCGPLDNVRTLATLRDGRVAYVSVHGLVDGECFYLDIPGNPRPW